MADARRDPSPERRGGAPRSTSSPGVDPASGGAVLAQPLLPRALVLLLGLAAALIAAAGIREVQSIVAPTFLAITLVITVHPLQGWLIKHRFPKALAAVISLIVIYVIVLGLIGALGLAVAQLVLVMPNYTGQFVSLYNGVISFLAGLGIDETALSTALSQLDPTSLIPTAVGAASSIFGATSIVVLLLTVLVFLVMDSTGLPARLVQLAGQRPEFSAAMTTFAMGVRRYWLVSAVFGLIVAVIDVAGLALLGVPLAVVWGLLAFITNFIPNIGFVIGLVPPALLALLNGGVRDLIIVVAFYCVVNLVVQVVIQPRFTGDAVGVTTTVSFLSLALWAVVLGPLGALLALPATLFVKSLLVDADPRNRWLNTLISSNPDTGLDEAPSDDAAREAGTVAQAADEDEPGGDGSHDGAAADEPDEA